MHPNLCVCVLFDEKVLYLGDKMEAVDHLLGSGSGSVTARNGQSQQQYLDMLKACIISASHSQDSFFQTVIIYPSPTQLNSILRS